MVPIMTLFILELPNPLMDLPDSVSGPSKSSILFDMQPVHRVSTPYGFRVGIKYGRSVVLVGVRGLHGHSRVG